MPGGEVWLQKPVAYQAGPGGEKQLVGAAFVVEGGNHKSAIETRNPKLGSGQSTIGFRVGSKPRAGD